MAKKKNPKFNQRQRLYFTIVSIFLVLILGTILYKLRYHPSSSPIKPSTTEVIAMTKNLTNKGGKIKITQVVPKKWQSSIVPKTEDNSGVTSSSDDIGTFAYQYYPPSPEHVIKSQFDHNILSFSDVSKWLDTTDPFSTQKEKQDHVNFLINLRKSKTFSFTDCAPLMRVGCYGSYPIYVESADKVFSGYAIFLTESHQAISYDPKVSIYLAGKLPNGRTIYAWGLFQVYDNLSKSLVGINTGPNQNAAKVGEAWSTLKNNLPKDDKEIYSQIIKSVDSLTITWTP